MIKSPVQLDEYKKQIAREATLLKMMSDLVNIHDKFIQKLNDVDYLINKKVGPKGDSPSKAEIIALIKPLIPEPIPGRNGHTPTRMELLDLIEPLIPSTKELGILSESDVLNLVKKSIPKDYLKKKDIAQIIEAVQSRIKVEKPTVNVDELINKIKSKKTSISDIEGLEQTISAFRHQLSNGYLHGGGDTVVAGTGVVITSNANGTKTISSSVSSISTVDISSQFDGSTTTFTLPSYTTILSFTITGWPPNGNLRPTVDFTTPTGTTVALVTSQVQAPPSGATGIILYS